MTPLGQQRLNIALMFLAGVIGILDVAGVFHGPNAHTYCTAANGVIMLAIGSLPKWWGVPSGMTQSLASTTDAVPVKIAPPPPPTLETPGH